MAASSSSSSSSVIAVLPSDSMLRSLSPPPVPFPDDLQVWRWVICFLPFEEAVVDVATVSKACSKIFAPGEHWVLWQAARWPNDVSYSMILKKREVAMDDWISQW